MNEEKTRDYSPLQQILDHRQINNIMNQGSSSNKSYNVRNFLKQIDENLVEMRKKHMSSTKSLIDFEYT